MTGVAYLDDMAFWTAQLYTPGEVDGTIVYIDGVREADLFTSSTSSGEILSATDMGSSNALLTGLAYRSDTDTLLLAESQAVREVSLRGDELGILRAAEGEEFIDVAYDASRAVVYIAIRPNIIRRYAFSN